ncbi:MAG TPA: lipopolysaccharide biosynthesis protein [Stellaceae bacterium]|jgi:teichuronic acid exporter|nr:lipopolysaccharide biosynthesis protein [Stellaceae bacterium]
MIGSVSLKRSVMSAVGWATATRFVAQMATWAMTLATVRFLSPADYGLMAVAMTITSVISALSTVGLIDAVVQSRRVTEDDLQSVFGLVLLINAACLVLLCVLAYPAAWFYREPRLVPLLQVASLIFVATAFQAVPRAQLDKRLDLKTVSRVDLVARITGGAAVLGLAWKGFGVWSLIAGPLLAAALQALGFSLAVGWLRRPRLNLANLYGILRSGGLRTVEQVLWYAYMNSDIFIIGRLLGADTVGVYWVARNLAAMPIDKFAMTVRPAAFPAFALVQHDRKNSLRYLCKATRLLAFICFPVLFGLAATAPQAVALALGPKWTLAAAPVAILAIAMAFRPIGLVIAPFLMGLGEFGASLRNTLFAAVLFPTAFAVGSHWGLIGVCTAWLFATPVQLIVLIRRAALVAGSSIGELLAPLLSPLAGSVLMYVAVTELSRRLPGGWHVWPSFLLLTATGVAVYSLYAALFMRPLFAELRDLARR